MQHSTFLNFKDLLKNTELGGTADQNIMVPNERRVLTTSQSVLDKAKKAAVLALFYPNQNGHTCLALTLRPNYSGTHSSQVSFPGGKQEVKDRNLEETALRETFEEIGIEPAEIETIRKITNVYIPPSNFLVTPFIGIAKNKLKFIKNHEVEKMIEVPIKDLLNDSFLAIDTKKTFYAEKVGIPYFNFDNQMVWGATAMIISEIKELIKRL